MKFIHTQKYVRTSPTKIKAVADLIRGKKAVDALNMLPLVHKRSADFLVKVLNAAVANAKGKGVNEVDLTIKELQVNQGPKLKRGRPVSRGRWHPYKRRMSHVRVVLESKTTQNPPTKRDFALQEKSKAQKPKVAKTRSKSKDVNGRKKGGKTSA